MSDFLTNLAARAIAQPTLRPRTRSRFEPSEETTPEWPTVVWRAGRRLQPAGPPAASAGGESSQRARRETGRQAGGGPAGWKPALRAGTAQPRAVATPPTEVRVEREVERDVQRVIETNERVIRVPQIEHVGATSSSHVPTATKSNRHASSANKKSSIASALSAPPSTAGRRSSRNRQ